MNSRAPGWWPDPDGRRALRYWDGQRWTGEVSDVDPRPVPPGGPVSSRRAGWLSDPSGSYHLRYFDGQAWTDRVSWSEPLPEPPEPFAAATPAARPLSPQEERELEALAYTFQFVKRGFEQGEIDARTYDRLIGRIGATRQRVLGPPVPASMPERAPGAAPASAPPPSISHPAPPRPPAPVTAPAVPTPPRWSDLARDWLGETSHAVRSDLAVHGLAYLGVLLLFAGVFGFVAFTFDEVRTTLKPIAEVAIPASIFLAAWFLRRRGVLYVANALELLGGAVLPVVVLASFVDGSDVPPDFTGGALEATLSTAAAVIAGLYAWATLRHPTTLVRFLVAPVAWLAVMMATLATDPNLLGGEQITRPVPWQTALTLVAVLITALVARRWHGHVLADASLTVILPGLAVLVMLQVLASAREGWPIGPTIIAGLATLAVLEVQASRIPATAVVVAQGVALAGTFAMLGPRLEGAWLAALAVPAFLLLAEWEGFRRPIPLIAPIMLTPAALGLLLCLEGAWAIVVAYASASLWSHVRRLRPASWAPSNAWMVGLAALLPVGVAIGLFQAFDPRIATVTVAGLVVVVALTVGLTAWRSDPFWSWWVPGAGSGAAILGGMVATDPAIAPSDYGPLAAAAGLGAIAIMVSTAPVAVRTWLGAAALSLAAGLAFTAAEVSSVSAALAFAVAGGLLVVLALDRRLPNAGDLGLIGHLLTIGALGSLGEEQAWGAVAVMGIVAGAWIVTTAAQETVGSAVADRLESSARSGAAAVRRVTSIDRAPGEPRRFGVAAVPAIAAFVTTPGFVLALFDQAGWAVEESGEALVVWAGIALLDALVARWGHHHFRLSVVAAWTAFVLVLLSLPAESDPIYVITSALGIATVVVVPAERRARVMVWLAWALSGVVAVRGAVLLGLADDDAQVAAFAWGSAVTVAALWLDRRSSSGDRRRYLFVHDWTWLVPLTFGVITVISSYGLAAAEGPGAFGWWSLAFAVVALASALVADAPVVGLLATGLAADAAARLLPWPLPDQPWNLFVAVALLTAAAAALQPVSRGRAPLERWDLWPFAQAHVAAAVIVLAAETTTSPTAAYLAVGGWALTVFAWTRRWPWLLTGVVLVNVGATSASLGWLSLTLALSAVAATLAAAREQPPIRTMLQVTGAASFAGAWVSGAGWLDVTTTAGISSGAVTAGVIVLGAALALRWRVLSLDWVEPWAGVGVGSVFVAGLCAMATESRPSAIGVGIGVLLVSIASGVAAAPSGQPPLRESAAGLFVAAVILMLVGLEVTMDVTVAVTCATGFIAVLGASLLAYRRPESPWERPAIVVAIMASGTAIAVGIHSLPRRDLLVPALAVAGAQAAVFGAVTRRVAVLTLAPILLCASWLAFASDALAGNPQWFTLPIGVTVLIVEGLLRGALRQRGEDPAPPSIIAVDYAGMAFVVGAALLQTATANPWYGVAAIGLGILIAGWGVTTHVRRRALFGIATVVVAVFLLVAAPLAERVPELTGPTLWLVIASIGLVAIMVAAFLEQGRRRVGAMATRLTELTRGWE